jgi:kinesin family protein 18/19
LIFNRFDSVYDSSSKQQDIYETEIRPWLDDTFKGVNTSVFCYGATGSGKTHTISGSATDIGSSLDS